MEFTSIYCPNFLLLLLLLITYGKIGKKIILHGLFSFVRRSLTSSKALQKKKRNRSESSNKFISPSETSKIISYYTLNVIEVHHAHEGYEPHGSKGQKEQGHTCTDFLSNMLNRLSWKVSHLPTPCQAFLFLHLPFFIN